MNCKACGTKALVAVILLALGVGCVSMGPDRGRKTGATVPQPPWITNKDNSDPPVAENHDPVLRAIWVPPGKTGTIYSLEKTGSLFVGAGARVEVNSLVEVSDRILVASDAVLIAPNLRKCGTLVVGPGAEVVVPELAQAVRVMVGFQVNMDKDDRCIVGKYGSRPPADDPVRDNGARVEAPTLDRVVSSVLVGDGASLVASALQSCGARVGYGAKLDAPCAPKASPRPGFTWSPSGAAFSECF